MTETSVHTCDICFKKYKNSRSLASHRYTQHNNPKDSSRCVTSNDDDPKCTLTIKEKKREYDFNSEHIETHDKESVDENEVDRSDEEVESESNSHSLEYESEDELSLKKSR